MESRVGLIIICAFFQVIQFYFGRRYITVIHPQLTVFLLIEYMIVVEHCLYLHLGRITEHLAAVEPVLVYRNISVKGKFEHECEQVQLLVYRLHGIVKTRIGILVEIYLPIYVTAPHHILRHVYRRWKHQLRTLRQLRCTLTGCGSLLLGITASLGLCRSRHNRKRYGKYEQ